MSLSVKDPKPKKCAHCGEKFTPRRGSIGQKVCSPACAIAVAPDNREKADKAIERQKVLDHREAKERVKKKGEYAKEAQQAVNAWVRERDRFLPCISCGVNYPLTSVNVWDAGHLRSVAASSANRFNTLNINKQCVRCNRYLSSNAIEYRIRLIEKIGHEKVEAIYAANHKPRFSIEYLIRVRDVFRRRLRILRKVRSKGGEIHDEILCS